MSYDVSWVYRIVDKYSTPLKKIAAAMKKMQKNAKKASKAFKKIGASLATVRGALTAIGGIVAISFPIRKAIDFESVMLDVRKVMTFKSEDQFNKFREGIFKTSIAMGRLPKDIAAIAVEGGKLGIGPENMQGFVDLITKVSIAFDMTEQTAAATVGSIKSKLGLLLPDITKLMDGINFLADNTAANAVRTTEIVQRTVGTMKTIKMPPELIAGWAAFADQLETSPQLAASGLNQMVIKMMKMPGMMKKLLSDPNKAIKDTFKKYAEMDEVRRSQQIIKDFGLETSRFVMKSVNSLELLDSTLEKVSKSNYVGSMTKELKIKMGGAATAIGKVAAAIDFAMIEIGDAFLPIIKDLVPIIVAIASGIRNFVKEHPMLTKIIIAFIAIAAALAVISVLVGFISTAVGIMFSPVVLAALAVVAIVAAFYYLLGLIFKIWDAMGGLSGIFNSLKRAIMFWVSVILTPFRILLSLISVLWGDLTGIQSLIDDVFSSYETLANLLSKGWNAVVSFFGGDDEAELKKSVTVESRRKDTLNGTIEVRAKRGTEVTHMDFDHSSVGDTGMNMRTVK